MSNKTSAFPVVTVRSMLTDQPLKIMGDNGEVVTITGEVYESNAIPDLIVVEVALGSLYMDPDAEVMVYEM